MKGLGYGGYCNNCHGVLVLLLALDMRKESYFYEWESDGQIIAREPEREREREVLLFFDFFF